MEPTLKSLPVDLLGLITDYITGFDIASLWFCGSAMLCWSMRHGGVRNFEITDSSFSRFLAWPFLVSNFNHLAYFSFPFLLKALGEPISPNTLVLPSSITSISMNSVVLDVFVKQCPLFTSCYPLLHTLHMLGDRTLPLSYVPTTVQDLQWETEQFYPLPKGLTRLNLRTCGCIKTLNLSDLTALQDLTLIEKPLNLDLGIFPLVELRVGFTLTPQELALLQPMIKSLAYASKVFNVEVAQALPRTLENLEFISCPLSPLRTSNKLDASASAALPRTLISLYIEENFAIEKEAIAKLPVSLKHFHIGNWTNLIDYHTERIRFPPNLTTFMTDSTSSSLLKLPIFSDCLTHLSCPMQLVLSNDPIDNRSYASSQKELRVIYEDNQVDNFDRPLPSSLTSLKALFKYLHLIYDHDDTSPNFSSNSDGSRPAIPIVASLTYIPASPPFRNEDSVDRWIELQQNDGQNGERPIYKLPRGLKRLHARILTALPLVWLLPPGLVHLELSLVRVFSSLAAITETFIPGWQRLLPKTLTFLRLDLRPRCIDYDFFAPSTFPPSLQSLHILTATNCAPIVMNDLPSSLTELFISFSMSFDWKGLSLSHMKMMKELTISCDSDPMPWPENVASLLPPSLTVLYFVNSQTEVMRKLKKAQIQHSGNEQKTKTDQ
jgi:hypothetical protein